jgi:hypothetical protein
MRCETDGTHCFTRTHKTENSGPYTRHVHFWGEVIAMTDASSSTGAELEKLFSEAVRASAVAALRLNQQNNSSGDYIASVTACKSLFPTEGDALNECIKGCATVNAPKGDKLAPI